MRRRVTEETVQDVNDNRRLVIDVHGDRALGHGHRSAARRPDRLIGYLLRRRLLNPSRGGGAAKPCVASAKYQLQPLVGHPLSTVCTRCCPPGLVCGTVNDTRAALH